MDFVNFLSYGAIGISLALAILAYRLLTKVQNSQTERPAIIKQIKNFLWVAVFLSVFFGMMEYAFLLNDFFAFGSFSVILSGKYC